MIDTGSSINIIREKFDSLEEKEENLTVYTIKGPIKLNKSITIKPTSVCSSAQKLYIHKFSDNYDFLLGRKYLEDTSRSHVC